MAFIDPEPAFPVTPLHDPISRECKTYSGMTLRDWFAGRALPALMTDPEMREQARSVAMQGVAESEEAVLAHWAYEQADAMLAEREKEAS